MYYSIYELMNMIHQGQINNDKSGNFFGRIEFAQVSFRNDWEEQGLLILDLYFLASIPTGCHTTF